MQAEKTRNAQMARRYLDEGLAALREEVGINIRSENISIEEHNLSHPIGFEIARQSANKGVFAVGSDTFTNIEELHRRAGGSFVEQLDVLEFILLKGVADHILARLELICEINGRQNPYYRFFEQMSFCLPSARIYLDLAEPVSHGLSFIFASGMMARRKGSAGAVGIRNELDAFSALMGYPHGLNAHENIPLAKSNLERFILWDGIVTLKFNDEAIGRFVKAEQDREVKILSINVLQVNRIGLPMVSVETLRDASNDGLVMALALAHRWKDPMDAVRFPNRLLGKSDPRKG